MITVEKQTPKNFSITQGILKFKYYKTIEGTRYLSNSAHAECLFGIVCFDNFICD